MQFMPELICAMEQGDVIRMFEIGLPDNACFAMRAASIVTGQKCVQTQHTGPPAGQVSQAGAAETTGAQNDDVDLLVHSVSPLMKL